jgi:PAS domain S-box-containing protein
MTDQSCAAKVSLLQIKQLYKAVNTALVVSIINGGILISVLWPSINHQILMVWFAILTLVCGIRGFTAYLYHRSPSEQREGTHWYRLFMLGTVAAALIWAGASIFLFPVTDTTRQVFVAFVVGGMAAGSLTSLAFAKWPFYLFLCVSMIPLLVRFFISDNELGIIMGLMLTSYLVLLLLASGRVRYYIDKNTIFKLDAQERENALAQRNALHAQRNALHVQHTPLGVIECDINECVTLWNEAAERIFGFSAEEVMGLSVVELIIPTEEQSAVRGVWQKALASEGSVRSFNENKTKAGNIITCEWYNTPLVDDAGVFIGMASLVQDVTQHVHAQFELAQSEASFRALFELSDEAMVTFRENVVEDCNIAAVKLFGFDNKEDFLKRRPSDFSPTFQPDGKNSFVQAKAKIAIAIEGGKNSFEWVHCKANGEDFQAEVLITPMVLKGIDVLQAIVRDITQAKNAQAALIAAKLEAERSNRAKSDFLSRMSHELRTPLNAILGFGQLLEMHGDRLDAKQRENVDQILMAGHHLLALINELLDMAAIESGNVSLNIKAVPLDFLLQDCKTLVKQQCNKATIELIDNLSDKGFVVRADGTRLKQVLLNLLGNAVKYNRKGGSITIGGQIVEGQCLRINIIDKGYGLNESELAKLFVPFERLSAGNHIEGSGIGLSICKHLMDVMGGSIGVHSIEGEGSTFWMEIALYDALNDALN